MSLSGPIGMFSTSMADLASFQYGRDDEEGEYSIVDISSDEDDPSGAVSSDHE